MRIHSVQELYDKGFREFRVVHSGEAEALQEEIAALRERNAGLERQLLSARLAGRERPDLSDVYFGAPHMREEG